MTVWDKLQGDKITIGGKEYVVRKFAGGHVRGVDVGEFRLLTQNPMKESSFGRRARRGEKIVWVLRHGEYLGRFEGGKFVKC